MTNLKKQIATLAAVAAVGAAAFALPASAQSLRSNGWYKACSDQGETKICNVQYQVVASTGQVVTSINLADISGKITRKVFQITVPTGRLIPPGIELTVDEKQSTKIPYAFCTPRTCAAEVPLGDDLIKVLKAGGELTVTSINFQGKPNPIKVTLEGFTAAFDGPPIKQDELQSKQKELEAELLKKAEETRKKLQEAQDAAKD